VVETVHVVVLEGCKLVLCLEGCRVMLHAQTVVGVVRVMLHYLLAASAHHLALHGMGSMAAVASFEATVPLQEEHGSSVAAGQKDYVELMVVSGVQVSGQAVQLEVGAEPSAAPAALAVLRLGGVSGLLIVPLPLGEEPAPLAVLPVPLADLAALQAVSLAKRAVLRQSNPDFDCSGSGDADCHILWLVVTCRQRWSVPFSPIHGLRCWWGTRLGS